MTGQFFVKIQEIGLYLPRKFGEFGLMTPNDPFGKLTVSGDPAFRFVVQNFFGYSFLSSPRSNEGVLKERGL